MDFEKSLKKLELILVKIENNNLPIDKLIKLYEEGNKIEKHVNGKNVDINTIVTMSRLKLEKLISYMVRMLRVITPKNILRLMEAILFMGILMTFSVIHLLNLIVVLSVLGAWAALRICLRRKISG